MNSEEFERIKVCLLGGDSVGKKTLGSYATKAFRRSYREIIGVNINELLLMNNTEIIIWSIASLNQKKYHTMLKHFIHDADWIILLYDLTQSKSFTSISTWIDRILEYAPDNVKIALIGNKVDLEEKRVISKVEGENFAKKYESIAFFEEISAKSERDVLNLYQRLAKIILDLKNKN